MNSEEYLKDKTWTHYESHQFKNALHEEGEYVKLEDAKEYAELYHIEKLAKHEKIPNENNYNMKILKLKKDIKSSYWFLIKEGTILTEDMWCKLIGRLGGIDVEIGSDKDFWIDITNEVKK